MEKWKVQIVYCVLALAVFGVSLLVALGLEAVLEELWGLRGVWFDWFYRDQIEQTIREMVRPEALR